MNTAEVLLPVDGILEVLSSFTGHRQSRIAHSAFTPLRRQRPKVSDMGIVKAVKGYWGRQDGRALTRGSSSSGTRQISSDRLRKNTKKCQRIVFLGAPMVGKTNILRRFLGEEFEERYDPTIEDFYTKLFRIGGETHQVDLLDAAAEKDFPAKRRLSILAGDIFLLVFSLDDRDSLNEVGELLGEIKAAKAKLHKSNHPTSVPVVVCANKADLDALRCVSESEVREVLGENVPFFEASAKTGAGLEAVFVALASLGGLPEETSPSRHQLVSFLTFQSLESRERGGTRRRNPRGQCAPCAAVEPLARRPSFTSDLQMVLGSSAAHKKLEKCQIQ